MWISGFGLRQSEVEARSGEHVSCQADNLICVGTGGSDSRHEADSPSHAIPKISWNLDAAVWMMSINKGINDANRNYPILEAS